MSQLQLVQCTDDDPAEIKLHYKTKTQKIEKKGKEMKEELKGRVFLLLLLQDKRILKLVEKKLL